MYSWALRVWRGVSVHERQALLAGGSRAAGGGLMDGVIGGRRMDMRKWAPCALTSAESELLDRWTSEWRAGETPIREWVRRERVFGLEIPKEHGGLGLSPLFHSRFLRRLATMDRDGDWLHRIMVPNSLGPSQLILKHGTETQKREMIPRLASGELTPCFGLTGPWNGSDAGAIRDTGVIEVRDGVEGVRFSCEKRWITLSPEAHLMGLAIRIPPHGITLIMVDPETIRENIVIRHHRPIGSIFPNGHIIIRDAWVPLEDAIIGGKRNLGRGWMMLMECLQQGRGISLPSVADGANACVLWKTVFYALTRRQFSKALIEIEAVQTMICEMTIRVYLGRLLCEVYHSANNGSSAFSAIMKFVMTQFSRDVVLRGMDIFAGKGITMGPRNPIAHFYIQNPIGITVEGSNPLTKHLIIPVQSLFEHHTSLRGILGTLEDQDPKEFYRSVLQKIPEVLGIVSSCVLPGDAVRRASAFVGVESYICLLYGQSLRKRQVVSAVFANHVIGVLLLHALEWSREHHPGFGNDEILRNECVRFIREHYFDCPPNSSLSRSLMNPFLQRQHGDREHVSMLVLHDREFRSWIEQDIVLMSEDEPLRQVSELWKRHSGTIQTFHLSEDLQRQVIDVDSFDEKK